MELGDGSFGRVLGYPVRIGDRIYTHKFYPLTFKHAFRFLRVCGREPCQRATRGMPLCCLTRIHAIVSRSPWGHGSVALDKRPCKQ